MIVSEKSGGNFPPVDPGMHVGWCYGVIDLGTQPSEIYKAQHKLLLMFELDEKVADGEHKGEPYRLSKFYTASLSDRAALRAELENWRGCPFEAHELAGFDMAKLLGVPAFINVSHKEGKARINTLNPIPKALGIKRYEGGKTYHLDLSKFNAAVFAELPEWVQEKIRISPEYAQAVKGGASSVAEPADIDDGSDIPF